MKATGMIRRIDDLGRVVIPKEIRTVLGFEENQALEIFLDGERVVLQKYQPGCVLCGSVEGLNRHKTGKFVCLDCMS